MTAGPDLTDTINVVQRTLAFNADNMPTQVAHPNGGTVNITYDGETKRAKKSGPNGTTYYFANEFEQTGATEICYVFAGNLRVAMVKDYAYNQTKYFHKDHLGSSSVISNADGTLYEKTRYMPFGGKHGDGAGISSTAYRFTDQELDAESGLYNYDSRLYDPIIGRFASADSFVQDPSNSSSFNRYSYCWNNPIKYIDPSGYYANMADAVDDTYSDYGGNKTDGSGNDSGISDDSNENSVQQKEVTSPETTPPDKKKEESKKEEKKNGMAGSKISFWDRLKDWWQDRSGKRCQLRDKDGNFHHFGTVACAGCHPPRTTEDKRHNNAIIGGAFAGAVIGGPYGPGLEVIGTTIGAAIGNQSYSDPNENAENE